MYYLSIHAVVGLVFVLCIADKTHVIHQYMGYFLQIITIYSGESIFIKLFCPCVVLLLRLASLLTQSMNAMVECIANKGGDERKCNMHDFYRSRD